MKQFSIQYLLCDTILIKLTGMVPSIVFMYLREEVPTSFDMNLGQLGQKLIIYRTCNPSSAVCLLFMLKCGYCQTHTTASFCLLLEKVTGHMVPHEQITVRAK